VAAPWWWCLKRYKLASERARPREKAGTSERELCLCTPMPSRHSCTKAMFSFARSCFRENIDEPNSQTDLSRTPYSKCLSHGNRCKKSATSQKIIQWRQFFCKSARFFFVHACACVLRTRTIRARGKRSRRAPLALSQSPYGQFPVWNPFFFQVEPGEGRLNLNCARIGHHDWHPNR